MTGARESGRGGRRSVREATVAFSPSGPSRRPLAGVRPVAWGGLLLALGLSLPAGSVQPQELSRVPILYIDAPEGEIVVRGVRADGEIVPVPVRTRAAVPVWAPDGEWLAFTDGEERLVRASLAGERELLATASAGERFLEALDWSPDGSALAAVAAGDEVHLVVVDAERRAVRSRTPLPEGLDLLSERLDLQWSPDGSHVLVTGERVLVVDPSAARARPIVAEATDAVWLPSSDGILVLRGGDAADGSALPVADRVEQVPLEGDAAVVLTRGELKPLELGELPLLQLGLALAPEGWKLALWGYATDAAGGFRSVVHLYDVIDGGFDLTAPARTVRVPGRWVLSAHWSPDGRLLAAPMASENGLAVAVVDAASGQVRDLASPVVDDDVAWMYVLVRSFLGWSH